MNEGPLPTLFYAIAILLSIARSAKQLRTFLYSSGANLVTLFSVLLLLFFFLPVHSARALEPLAQNTGRMAGVIVAYLYSTKTQVRAPKSVYLIAFSGTIVLLAVLALGDF